VPVIWEPVTTTSETAVPGGDVSFAANAACEVITKVTKTATDAPP
jgi:hypothetical protein